MPSDYASTIIKELSLMSIAVKNKLKKALQISSNDNVAIALADLQQGEKISVLTSSGREEIRVITVNDNISFGHKIALENIGADEKIVKYSYKIGLATKMIHEGDHVHMHNIVSQYLHEKE